MGKGEDLTGRVFGLLTVLGKVESRKGHTLWLCRCKCGKVKKIYRSNLIHQKSCGCLERPTGRRLSFVKCGEKMGHLTILYSLGSRVYKTEHSYTKRQFVLCKCDCGRVVELPLSQIRSGQKTCGCRRNFL